MVFGKLVFTLSVHISIACHLCIFFVPDDIETNLYINAEEAFIKEFAEAIGYSPVELNEANFESLKNKVIANKKKIFALYEEYSFDINRYRFQEKSLDSDTIYLSLKNVDIRVTEKKIKIDKRRYDA